MNLNAQSVTEACRTEQTCLVGVPRAECVSSTLTKLLPVKGEKRSRYRMRISAQDRMLTPRLMYINRRPPLPYRQSLKSSHGTFMPGLHSTRVKTELDKSSSAQSSMEDSESTHFPDTYPSRRCLVELLHSKRVRAHNPVPSRHNRSHAPPTRGKRAPLGASSLLNLHPALLAGCREQESRCKAPPPNPETQGKPLTRGIEQELRCHAPPPVLNLHPETIEGCREQELRCKAPPPDPEAQGKPHIGSNHTGTNPLTQTNTPPHIGGSAPASPSRAQALTSNVGATFQDQCCYHSKILGMSAPENGSVIKHPSPVHITRAVIAETEP